MGLKKIETTKIVNQKESLVQTHPGAKYFLTLFIVQVPIIFLDIFASKTPNLKSIRGINHFLNPSIFRHRLF